MKSPNPISSFKTPALIALEKKLFGYAGDDRVITSDDMRAVIAALPKPSFSFSTGLSRLDELMGRVETGELIAIGGPTKNGKTLLAQTMTEGFTADGAHCIWFSFEVPVRQFMTQIDEHVKFYLPQDLKQADLEWLRDRILEGKLKYDTRIVFLDNLHHLVDFATAKNVSVDLGVVIRCLKRMAIELNVAIFVLCHSRKPEIAPNGFIREVTEWDLRDSSFIPQECDSTIMVQRKINKDTKEFTAQAIVKVCLHRRTGTMGRKVHVIKTGERLEEDVTIYG